MPGNDRHAPPAVPEAPLSVENAVSPAPQQPFPEETPAPAVGAPGRGRLQKPFKPPKAPEQLAFEIARKNYFREAVWKPLLKPAVVLVSICAVASLLLGLTNLLTAGLIEKEAERVAVEARQALLPKADGFEKMPLELPDSVAAVYEATNGAGYVIESEGRGGYGGSVPAIVAFTADGVISGVTFPANDETVGLGQKICLPVFSAQFAQRPAQAIQFADIDAIASATLSSNAALDAVNTAINAYHTLLGAAKEAA